MEVSSCKTFLTRENFVTFSKVFCNPADYLGMSGGIRRDKRFVACAVVLLGILSGCCHEAEVPLAVRGLYSPEPREKNRSLQTLAQCPQQSQPSVQRIAALMYDPNVGVASSAAYTLRKMNSPQAREALEAAEQTRLRKRRQG